MTTKEGGLRGSIRNVGVGVSAIPDSGDLHARYDATELSLNDGDSVSTWPDETGNGHDLTAGTAPQYVASGINGNPVVETDGVDDYLKANFSELSQPNHIFAVIQFQSLSTSEFNPVYDGDGSGGRNQFQADKNPDWSYFAGDSPLSDGAADLNPHISNVIFDGSNSELRIDGVSELTGSAGTDGLAGFRVGAGGGLNNFGNVRVGEILVYPQDKTAIQTDVEQYLSDKWGITV